MIGNELILKRPAQDGIVLISLAASHMDHVPDVTVDIDTDKRLRDGKGGCYDAHWIPEDKRRWEGRGGIIGGIRIRMGEAMKVVVRLLVPVNEWPGFRE